jgi:hypothetical protein
MVDIVKRVSWWPTFKWPPAPDVVLRRGGALLVVLAAVAGSLLLRLRREVQAASGEERSWETRTRDLVLEKLMAVLQEHMSALGRSGVFHRARARDAGASEQRLTATSGALESLEELDVQGSEANREAHAHTTTSHYHTITLHTHGETLQPNHLTSTYPP